MANFVRRFPFIYDRALRILNCQDAAGYRERQLQRVLKLGADLGGYRGCSAQSLDDFPLISSAEVRARPEAFLRPTILPTSIKWTSGTTGTALRVSRSLNAVIFEQATYDWIVAHAGISLRDARVAVLRGYDIKSPADHSPPFWRCYGKTLIFSSNHLSRDTVRHFVDALNAFRPDVVFAYPSALEHLVRLMNGTGLIWRCPLAVTSSEMLTPVARKSIANALKATVFDCYGQAERAAYAYSIEEGKYWFIPTYSVVELIQRDGREGAEIVGTSLHNNSQILIRYGTGDYATTETKDPEILKEVADGRRPFKAVLGRHNDVIIAKGGRVLVGIDHIPRGLEDLGRFQFIQEAPDRVRILVQSEENLSEEARHKIISRARTKLPDDIALSVEFVDALTRTSSGKIPFVVQKLSTSDAL